MSQILNVDDENFASQVLQADKPVLVDFWAPWCGPCKAIAPVLEALAEQYSDKIQIVKLNVDDSEQTPGQYGVRGIPTLMLFKQGEMVATQVGAMTQSQLTDFIDSHIKE